MELTETWDKVLLAEV